MIFEWDEAKARSNLAKHGVAFEDARRVWDDPLHAVIFDRFEAGEERWQAIGRVGPAVLLLVVHVFPEEDDERRIRIVSARRATAHERRRYEQEP
jgi:uncharacterized DUF497 family protein